MLGIFISQTKKKGCVQVHPGEQHFGTYLEDLGNGGYLLGCKVQASIFDCCVQETIHISEHTG